MTDTTTINGTDYTLDFGFNAGCAVEREMGGGKFLDIAAAGLSGGLAELRAIIRNGLRDPSGNRLETAALDKLLDDIGLEGAIKLATRVVNLLMAKKAE